MITDTLGFGIVGVVMLIFSLIMRWISSISLKRRWSVDQTIKYSLCGLLIALALCSFALDMIMMAPPAIELNETELDNSQNSWSLLVKSTHHFNQQCNVYFGKREAVDNLKMIVVFLGVGIVVQNLTKRYCSEKTEESADV